MKNTKYLFVFLFIFFSLIGFVNANDRISVSLYKCVDGDTAWFTVNNKNIKVRFLAINTPESTTKIEKFGKEASEYTCNKLKNSKKIELEYDDNSDKTDKYNRDLAWIFVDNDLLQRKLIEKGYAEVKYLYGDYKYTNKLLESEIIAKNRKLNIWNRAEYLSFFDYIFFIIGIILFIILFQNKDYRKKITKKIKREIKKKLK